ncbi:MAG: AraC family ligand binding domain-containing protein, partial [Candidatus Sumerlaeota bacterium]
MELRATNYQRVEGDRQIFWDNLKRPLGDQQPYCLFQCSLGGAGFFRDEQGEYRLSPGRAFLAPVPSPTAYGLRPGESWEWIWMGFEGSLVFQLVELYNRNFGYRCDMTQNP